MKNLNLIIILVCNSLVSKAGNSISGKVLDEKKQALEFCNILLHSYSDSTYISGTTSDSAGNFSIVDIPDGNYFAEIIFIGYKTDTISSISLKENASIQVGERILSSDAAVLGNVEIKSTRPVIERKADRLVYNVENSAKSSGENSFDLLRSVPGVSISGNDQIKVNGKSDVQVMINGRVENLSGDQLNNFLKSIQSSKINTKF